MVALANTLEGVTPAGTTLAPGSGGNTGGASGDYFDVCQIAANATLASDAIAAHGNLGMKVATGATTGQCYASWTTQLVPSGIEVWCRVYFRAANLSMNMRLIGWFNGTTRAADLVLLTSGLLKSENTSGATIQTGSYVISPGQWYRLEAYCKGSGTVGQVEWKLYANPESTTPDEVMTSTATQNTLGVPNTFRVGQSAGGLANWGPVYYDSIEINDTGYPGPFVVPVTGTGAIAAKKIALAGSGTVSAPPITGTGAIASKKAKPAGTATYTAPVTGTGAIASKKSTRAGSGTYTPPTTATGAVHSKKIVLSGAGAVGSAIVGQAAIASKKIALTGAGTVGAPPAAITGTGAIASKKIILDGSGTLPTAPEVQPAPKVIPPPVLIPVTWDQLGLNDGERGDGLCTVVTNVEGWYGTPPLDGSDLERALSDGAVYGFKTLGARAVAITGAAAGPRDRVLWFARALAGQAASKTPADLIIYEDDGSGDAPMLTATVRADSDSLQVAWHGRMYFTYQVTLTAADPRLYEASVMTETLLPLASGTVTGRAYPWQPQRYYPGAELANTVRLVNEGNVPAPVWADYKGQLSESRLTDGVNTVHLAALSAGQEILVNTETLVAIAPGGATRASYLMAGSTPLTVPAYGEVTWSLYGTGTGSVTLSFRGAWA